jgi:biopolymer transport protein ExbB/TolQ
VGLGVGLVVIVLATFIWDEGSTMAVLLLDNDDPKNTVLPYPFSIQNLMHLMFFVGLAELFIRWKTAAFEMKFLDQGYLPEDDESVLQVKDLGPIRRRVAGRFNADDGFLPSLIDVSILQFQAGRSVDQMVSVLNSSLELMAHRVDLRYSTVRYVAWLIPTLGFIGTVMGISAAMTVINPANMDLGAVTSRLGVAFNTTFVALVESAVIVAGIHATQTKEERSLNLAGNYCLRNLVNRIYAG